MKVLLYFTLMHCSRIVIKNLNYRNETKANNHQAKTSLILKTMIAIMTLITKTMTVVTAIIVTTLLQVIQN